MITGYADTSFFSPDQVEVLGIAFENAWDTVSESSSPMAAPDLAEWSREVLARRIVETARSGVFDMERLREGALLHLARTLPPTPAVSP